MMILLGPRDSGIYTGPETRQNSCQFWEGSGWVLWGALGSLIIPLNAEPVGIAPDDRESGRVWIVY